MHVSHVVHVSQRELYCSRVVANAGPGPVSLAHGIYSIVHMYDRLELMFTHDWIHTPAIILIFTGEYKSGNEFAGLCSLLFNNIDQRRTIDAAYWRSRSPLNIAVTWVSRWFWRSLSNTLSSMPAAIVTSWLEKVSDLLWIPGLWICFPWK